MHKIKRNDPCWCGSNRKYKVCHEGFDRRIAQLRKDGEIVPGKNLIKNEEDLKWIREAARINNAVLDMVAENIRPGMSTGEVDRMVHEKTLEMGGYPAPLGYQGFPKACCISINDEVCHGIPEDGRILKEGDMVITEFEIEGEADGPQQNSNPFMPGPRNRNQQNQKGKQANERR